MESNVVVMPGHEAPTAAGAPNSDIVDLLERLVEEAKRGDLVGIAVATAIRDSNPVMPAFLGTAFEYDSGSQYALEAALNRLKWRWDAFRNEG